MPVRPQFGPQSGSSFGPQSGQQGGSPFGAQSDSGAQGSGAQGQSAQTQAAPLTEEQRDANMNTWLDEVVAAGGVAADTAERERLEHAAEKLTDVIEADGSELAPDHERLLGSVARALSEVTKNGDRAVDSDNAEYSTLLGQAEYKLEEFLEHSGDMLSAEASTRLTGALATLETVYADGVVSTAEQTSVGEARDAVCGVLKDDFVKLSDAGLLELQDGLDDLEILVDTGFLSLDADQWTAVNTAESAFGALIAGTGTEEVAHEALSGLREVLIGAIVDLANPMDQQRHGGPGGQSGGQSGVSGGADLFMV